MYVHPWISFNKHIDLRSTVHIAFAVETFPKIKTLLANFFASPFNLSLGVFSFYGAV
jgi:hypothetical protein